MRHSRAASRERRDSLVGLGAALIYLAAAVIDPRIALALFFLFVGTVAAIAIRGHLKEPRSASARNS